MILPQDTIPYGYCHCGCGQKTNIATVTKPYRGQIKGEPFRFVRFHGARSTKVAYIVDDETGCWNWNRGRNSEGYGKFKKDGKYIKGYVYFYEEKYGPVPMGLELDHKCKNKGCVNPDHLEAVTHQENVRRGRSAKINMEIARKIRSQAASESVKSISVEYGITTSHVRRILKNDVWPE